MSPSTYCCGAAAATAADDAERTEATDAADAAEDMDSTTAAVGGAVSRDTYDHRHRRDCVWIECAWQTYA